ncbi:cofilin [Cerrena zonata]|uniref:Cofilin n=1 Tax=Cerrena zonata TaxID=2478898 RepID=A0AAW0GJ59_9APHY
MSSGVGVAQSVLDTFQELKIGKKHKYIIFGLSADNTEIVVSKTNTDTNYETFLAELPENECRWAIYDLEYNKGEGIRNKLLFITWSPDDAKIKQKMLFASSKEALRRSLVGIATEIQGTDYSEVAYESVLEKATRQTH